MEFNELKDNLAKLSKIFPKLTTNEDTLFSWYLSTLIDDYLVDRDTISIEAIKLFEKVFPTFTTRLAKYGSTEADLIRFEYETMRNTCVESLQKIENAAPNVLYLKGVNKRYIRTNSPFIPFGMLESKSEPAFFLDALLNENIAAANKDEDVKYAVFTAYIYTFLIKEQSAFVVPSGMDYDEENPPKYTYILEEDLVQLRVKYPELTKRFEDDCLQYLSSLGYHDAFAEYVGLKTTEQHELAKLTPEQMTKLIEVRLKGKTYTIDYGSKSDVG